MLDPILIIDESRLVREAIAKIILSCGINKSSIACIENSNDALEFIEFSPVSLIICSDNMADSNPVSIRSEFVKHKKNIDLPLLILSHQENTTQPQIKKITEHIVTLAKPFKQQQILSALFELTQNKKFLETTNNNELLSHKQQPDPSVKPVEKATILVIDDESSNIDVAAGNLRQYYRVIAAKSGEHALKIVNNNKHKIELILLDIMMPEMDGYQVCSALKNSQKTAHIPIIFLSAKSEVADIKYGFELGAVDYITKPLNGDLLRARVATHIRLQQQKSALAEQVKTLKENAKLREDIEKITQHDLKGPLNNILFETFRLDDKNAANSINKAVNNVVNMINNSLNLYKIEQGIYSLTPQSTNLNQIINDAVNAVSANAKIKSIAFTLSGFEQQHRIFAEPLLCLSIFNNLLKNAVEASPLNSQITLSLTSEKDLVTFQVVNQGVIPPALRATLFDKYSSSNHNTGTGLGTYSAKLMTEVQHGKIYFDIVDEQETMFVVQLPTAQ